MTRARAVTEARPVTVALRWLDAITRAANLAGSGLILVLTVLVGTDVAGRTLFGAPLAGVPELVRLGIVVIVFLQVPAALGAGRMARTRGFADWLAARAPRPARALETLFDLVAVAVVWVIVAGSWPMLVRAWRRDEFEGAIGEFAVPVWPAKLALIVGGVLLMAQFAARIWRRHADPPA